MRIGTKTIGSGVFVIAEIGVNHDGDPQRAIALADAAAEAGADAVKLQYFTAEALLSRDAQLAGYQRVAGETDPVLMLRRLELPLDTMAMIVRHAHDRGLAAIVTVFSVEHVEPVAGLPWDAFKSASPDVVNKPLLEAMARAGRPMIVSTGAADLDEIRRARGWLDPVRDRLAFLQCVSSYPVEACDAELGACREVAEAVQGCAVGYSDHTTGVRTGAAAVAHAGAVILEKHLTDDCGRAGPDHAASLEPGEFASYVRAARSGRCEGLGQAQLRELLGEGRKRVLACEADVRTQSRQSVVAVRDLAPGQAISRKDLTVRRPGTGIEPWRIDELVGRRVVRAVAGGSLVRHGDFVGLEGAA